MKWYHWVLAALKAVLAIGQKHVDKHEKKD